ncbi:hypothetical protein [Microbacterium thalassium]|uniref:Uncharacterized protein n=1 Tax=Microbacterium thalassium TaxID=362649 RepID=A0A7X0FQ58_9MICO|nr:hypothetical protein [Microbacterium thalassium]MBB6391628.1 hypothetical protein [Microbacterium thalassium]GLK24231.1 hypothetical protein GCM10017607_15490 [Microbacterium thalassium]
MQNITKSILGLAAAGALAFGTAAPAMAAQSVTVNPGQSKKETGYVTGHYTSYYAEDGNGGWYWDLGDGRIQGNVASPGDLDQQSLLECDYVNNYRADFGDDPFMDTGWIINNINCSDGTHYKYLIVHEDDPRYEGDPENAIWGTWEYHVLSQSGEGNIANLFKPVVSND